jgi:mannose-1-phosphate guanylyltransferase
MVSRVPGGAVFLSTLRKLFSLAREAGAAERREPLLGFARAVGIMVAYHQSRSRPLHPEDRVMPPIPTSWAVILAGGDGTRLRPLTQHLTGDARPKQFCRLFGGETLLDQTRRRADLIIRPDRQLVVVTRAHAAYYADVARELLSGRLVAQPENRGTAPAIMLAALALRGLAGDMPMVVLPSDHDIADDVAFMGAVADALGFVSARRDAVVLLGLEPRSAETEYGWIEPVLEADSPVTPIRRFWEKPSAARARILLERGCLWNTFVMVGCAETFQGVIETAAPEIAAAFAPVGRALGTSAEAATLDRAYASLPTSGFSERVLARAANRFSVMRVKDVGWSDLGNPRRAVESARRRGYEPPWPTEATSPSA